MDCGLKESEVRTINGQVIVAKRCKKCRDKERNIRIARRKGFILWKEKTLASIVKEVKHIKLLKQAIKRLKGEAASSKKEKEKWVNIKTFVPPTIF